MNTSPTMDNASRVVEPTPQVKEFKKLLVPIDFSPASLAALRYAAAYAGESHGSVTLIAVIPDDQTVFEYGEIEAIRARERCLEQWQHDLKKLARETFSNTAHREVIKVGRAFEEIVRAARTLGSDLIIISRHSRDKTTQNELGSTAERVIRHATCPVLVVRPTAEDTVSTPHVDVY